MNREPQLFEHVVDTFVWPVLYARLGNGTWTDEDKLVKFRVVMPGDAVVVCINDEAHGWTQAAAARALAEGEEILPTDLCTTRVPMPDDEDLPYISAAATAAGWHVEFDLNRPHPRRLEFLVLGSDFARAAESALNQGLLRPYVENAFHAAEHFARAELLSHSLTAAEVLASKKHRQVASVFNLWANLGNTQLRFAGLLNDLTGLRSRATYAEGEFPWTPADAEAAQDTLLDFERHVHAVAQKGRSNRINLFATREITAGSLVGNDAGSIRPPRARRRDA